MNFTYHDAVEGMEDKSITEEDQAKYGTGEKGIRIPLSLGGVREDRDKKGDPVQVYDFVWNTKVVRDAQKDAGFRQSMVELAFNYIHQKFMKELDLRFTVPKMKYKGDTIQFQRIKIKKGPKISEVQMTDEERKELEQKAFEEEQRKEALREKEPNWKMYSVMNSRLNSDFSSQEYI